MFNLFPSILLTQFYVNPPLRGFSYTSSTDIAEFRKKAFKFLPFLILGKIIFALGLFPTWCDSDFCLVFKPLTTS